jgi:hypothetical protein
MRKRTTEDSPSGKEVDITGIPDSFRTRVLSALGPDTGLNTNAVIFYAAWHFRNMFSDNLEDPGYEWVIPDVTEDAVTTIRAMLERL